MLKPADKPEFPSRLPHRIAALLTALVFPLIWLGGLVTTFDAGMAVPDWPGTYGYNMFLYPVETWIYGPFDLFVEHGHRLLASLVGLIAIGLVVVTFRKEPRGWVRWFSVCLLLMVILQGCLGGARVLLDDRAVAKVHGCVGPAFFGLACAFCVVTSRWWWQQQTIERQTGTAHNILKTFATFMMLISFGQLVIGAFLRHISVEANHGEYQFLIWGHVITASILVVGTLIHWVYCYLGRFKGIGVRSSVNVLMLLILVQFGLGVGTYVVKFGWPSWFADMNSTAGYVVGEKTFLQMNLITAHVAVGSLILAFWVVHVVRFRRAFRSADTMARETETRLKQDTTPTLVTS